MTLNYYLWPRCIIYVLLISLLFSCSDKDDIKQDYVDLNDLPTDTGGIHTANTLGSTDAPYAYYLYTPSSYDQNEDTDFPLLIFLHGIGEIGNSESDAEKLDLVLTNGPPMLIEEGNWSPSYSMVVASPQCHESSWDSAKLKELIEYLTTNYQINSKRIYLTGLSMGGYGTFNYIGDLGDSSMVAAAVPICGSGNNRQGASYKNIPIWAFHGDADNTVNVNGSIIMVDSINANKPLYTALVTIYPEVGHDSWTITYDGSGMGTESDEYAPFSQSIYNWMFQYQRQDTEEEELAHTTSLTD